MKAWKGERESVCGGCGVYGADGAFCHLFRCFRQIDGQRAALVLHWSVVVVSGHSYYSCLVQLLVKQVLEVNCLKYTYMSVSVLVVPKIDLHWMVSERYGLGRPLLTPRLSHVVEERVVLCKNH